MIVVYYLSGVMPRCQLFDDDKAAEAQAKCAALAAQGFTHIATAQQTFEQVGANDPGGIVSGGKLPDGRDYEWSKAHRAGAKPQREVIKK